jgi:hypothetical protein
MRTIDNLRNITRAVNDKRQIEQEDRYNTFSESDLFKQILSDFETGAMEEAKKGRYGYNICLSDYVDNPNELFGALVHAMRMNGYRFIGAFVSIRLRYSFSWDYNGGD